MQWAPVKVTFELVVFERDTKVNAACDKRLVNTRSQRDEEPLMTLADLLPEVRKLELEDKLTLFQELSAELSNQPPEKLLQPGAVYPVWTPFPAYGCAEMLMKALESDATTSK